MSGKRTNNHEDDEYDDDDDDDHDEMNIEEYTRNGHHSLYEENDDETESFEFEEELPDVRDSIIDAIYKSTEWFLKVNPRPPRLGRTGLVYDRIMLQHFHPSPHQRHPEQPGRLESIMTSLEKTGLADKMIRIPVKKANLKDILYVHSQEHVQFVNSLQNPSRRQDLYEVLEKKSVFASHGTVKAAYIACGSVVEALEQVHENNIKNCICVVRPPGHHAEKEEACGFCLFDNVAVAAATGVNRLNYSRILILDWDVHHGNGIQHAFEDSREVLYISLHRWDYGNFYPCGPDGSPTKVGFGKGKGYNINIAWNGHGPFGDNEYLTAFDTIVMPAARAFDPQVIFISAGFDAAIGDPLGACEVTPIGFANMLHMLNSLAEGKIILTLEGGYNLISISASMLLCANVLLGNPIPMAQQNKKEISADAVDSLKTTLKAHSELDNIFSKTWTSSSSLLFFNHESEEEEDEMERLQHILPADIKYGLMEDDDEEDEEEKILIFTSSPNVINNIQLPPSIQDGRPQADAICEECERISSNRNRNPHHQDNWVCLKCYNVYCSKHRYGHIEQHATSTGHVIAMSLTDLSILDLKLNAYLDGITNPHLRPIVEKFHQDKFNISLPKAKRSVEI